MSKKHMNIWKSRIHESMIPDKTYTRQRTGMKHEEGVVPRKSVLKFSKHTASYRTQKFPWSFNVFNWALNVIHIYTNWK